MGTIYKSFATAVLMLFFTTAAMAQQTSTVTTVPPLNGGNGSNGTSFNIKAYQSVVIKEFHGSFYAGTVTVDIWYSTDSINGTPNISTAGGWTKVASGVPVTTTTGGYGTTTLIPEDVNITIPAGETYGFFIQSSSTMIYTTWSSSNQSVFGDGTIHINTGQNVGYGGAAPTPTNHPRQFNGKVTYYLACETPSGVAISNLDKTSATFNWNPITTTTIGYEYAYSTSPTPPASGAATANTSVNLSSLAAGTDYYFHVRNKCSGTSFSGWETFPFSTPICTSVDTIKIGNVGDTSAVVTWNSVTVANNYEYVLSQSNMPPTDGSAATVTNATNVQLADLQPNTTYFFYIRSRCFSVNDSSVWTGSSFSTRAKCLPPTVSVNNATPNQPQLSWDNMPYAVGYEYAVTKSTSPPAVGTTIYKTNVGVPLPATGDAYYFHVRTKCYDIFTFSDWATTQLRESTSITELNRNGLMLQAYPNPAHDRLTVKLNGLGQNAAITLTDLTGKIILSQPVVSEEMQLDLSGISPGVYLLKYRDNGNAQTIKLLKK